MENDNLIYATNADRSFGKTEKSWSETQPSPEPLWMLEALDERGLQTWVVSEGESMSIGRAPGNTVRLHDSMVSAQHGYVRVEQGCLWVEEGGAESSIFSGGARVQRTQVASGDCFLVGRTVVTCTPLREERQDTLLEAPLSGIIGQSLAMRRMAKQVRRLATLRASVLIQGETGTGKELIAEALHQLGPRKKSPFLPLNVSALPGELADAELFGHERGAFTGAVIARVGAFEAARGGTLFLDEIAELAPIVQAKLLRTLENGEVRPLGSMRMRYVDVRVVAASWAPLLSRVQHGSFREDLYHRLAVFTVTLPPLRERKGDIALLANEFLRRSADEVGEHELLPAALSRLVMHPWPGNVRELRNVLLRAAVHANGRFLSSEHIDAALAGGMSQNRSVTKPKVVRQAEIRSLLAAHNGNVSGAARALGVARSTVRAWLRLEPRAFNTCP